VHVGKIKLVAIASALAIVACAFALILASGSWAKNAGTDESGADAADGASELMGQGDDVCPETDACEGPGTTISSLAAI